MSYTLSITISLYTVANLFARPRAWLDQLHGARVWVRLPRSSRMMVLVYDRYTSTRMQRGSMLGCVGATNVLIGPSETQRQTSRAGIIPAKPVI
jgi:redox-sensitive bicupin YhaK (pirin superfamily)